MAGEIKVDIESLLSILIHRFSTRPEAGIREAISNAIDAKPKSKTVLVTITDEKVSVEDDGNGMILSEIHEYWQTLAHSNKTEDDIGEFGIGRISLLRLGNEILLKTGRMGDWNKIILRRNGNFTEESIKEIPKDKSGTYVEVILNNEFQNRVAELEDYIAKVFKYHKHKILVNNKQISDKNFDIPEDYKYSNIQSLDDEKFLGIKAVLHPIGGSKNEGWINVYHRGIYVCRYQPISIEEKKSIVSKQEPSQIVPQTRMRIPVDIINIGGSINVESLTPVATRDGYVEDEYSLRLDEALNNYIEKTWTLVVDDKKFRKRFWKEIFDRAYRSKNYNLVLNLDVNLHDGSSLTVVELLTKAKTELKDIAFSSAKKRSPKIDRAVQLNLIIAVKTGSYNPKRVISELAKKEEIKVHYQEKTLIKIIKKCDKVIPVLDTEINKHYSKLKKFLQSILGSYIPNLEVRLIESSTRAADISIVDEESARLRLNIKESQVVNAANYINAGENVAALLAILPLISHEMTHYFKKELEGGIHDESFYKKMENVLTILSLKFASDIVNEKL